MRPMQEAKHATRLSYPLYLIKQGEALYTLWGQSPDGDDINGVALFADRALVAEQIEQDGIEGEILEVSNSSGLQQIAVTLGDIWLIYFPEDQEREMVAIESSQV